MWVYLYKDNTYTVGFYDPTGEWHAATDYASEAAAAKRVHYLNGGDWVKEEET